MGGGGGGGIGRLQPCTQVEHISCAQVYSVHHDEHPATDRPTSVASVRPLRAWRYQAVCCIWLHAFFMAAPASGSAATRAEEAREAAGTVRHLGAARSLQPRPWGISGERPSSFINYHNCPYEPVNASTRCSTASHAACCRLRSGCGRRRRRPTFRAACAACARGQWWRCSASAARGASTRPGGLEARGG